MCEVAVSLARSISYDSAGKPRFCYPKDAVIEHELSSGTVEFLVDEATAEFFFLEMNTRIQVSTLSTLHATSILTATLQGRTSRYRGDS